MSVAKEYLIQLPDKKDQIETAKRRRKEIALAVPGYKGLVYRDERIRSSSPEDAFANAISELMDRDKLLEERIAVLTCDIDLIRSQIRELAAGSPVNERKCMQRYARILWKRYEEEKGLKRIAFELKRDYAWVRKQHGYALRAFEKKYFREMEEYRKILENAGFTP